MDILQLGLDEADPYATIISRATLSLPPGDHRLLLALATGGLVSPERAFLASHGERLVEPGAVYSVIRRLRRLLGEGHIVTVPGCGYRLHQVRIWTPAQVTIALQAKAPLPTTVQGGVDDTL